LYSTLEMNHTALKSAVLFINSRYNVASMMRITLLNQIHKEQIQIAFRSYLIKYIYLKLL